MYCEVFLVFFGTENKRLLLRRFNNTNDVHPIKNTLEYRL